jgi:TetR/AcrR family transcriptional repressor of mexJK operon
MSTKRYELNLVQRKQIAPLVPAKDRLGLVLQKNGDMNYDLAKLVSAPKSDRRRLNESAMSATPRSRRKDRPTADLVVKPALEHTPKRGRPSLSAVAAINAAILEAAEEHFLTKGFDGAAMESIAAAAKVSKSTLYARYPDKEALLRAFLEQRMKRWSMVASREDWRLGKSLEASLRYYAESLVKWGVSPEVRALDRLLMGAFGQNSDAARILRETGRDSMIALIQREIEQWARLDNIPVRDAGRVATLLMATLTGWFGLDGATGARSETEALGFAGYVIDLLMPSRSLW